MLRPYAGWTLRGALFAGAYLVGFAAFEQGVATSNWAGMAEAGWLAHAYCAIGLFVLAGVDFGVPEGGTDAGRAMLWVAYFLAPAVTTGAVVEGLVRAVRPRWLERRALRDHFVIVGAGRIGVLYLEAFRQAEPRRTVILVGRHTDNPLVTGAIEVHRAHFVAGDIRQAATRAALALSHARGVVLVTDDDLANLDAAAAITSEFPKLGGRTAVHIGDLALSRTIRARLRDEAGTDPADRLLALPYDRVFNAHRIAARHLVHHQLRPHFAGTRTPDVVVLAGFGRVGQSILEALQEEAAGEFAAVVLVDRSIDMSARQFDAQVGFGAGYRRETIAGDISDPGVWSRVEELIRSHLDGGSVPVFLVGSDDDGLNFRTALWLRKRYPQSRIVARAFHDTPFTRRLSHDGDFAVFGIARLLRRSLEESHRAWFEDGPKLRPGEQDLPRSE